MDKKEFTHSITTSLREISKSEVGMLERPDSPPFVGVNMELVLDKLDISPSSSRRKRKSSFVGEEEDRPVVIPIEWGPGMSTSLLWKCGPSPKKKTRTLSPKSSNGVPLKDGVTSISPESKTNLSSHLESKNDCCVSPFFPPVATTITTNNCRKKYPGPVFAVERSSSLTYSETCGSPRASR